MKIFRIAAVDLPSWIGRMFLTAGAPRQQKNRLWGIHQGTNLGNDMTSAFRYSVVNAYTLPLVGQEFVHLITQALRKDHVLSVSASFLQ